MDEDSEVVDTDEEVDGQTLISTECIEERASSVAYANANIVIDHTLNEEMLRSSIATTLE